MNNPYSNNKKPISPFKKCCMSVLPIIFDGSLSQYEVVCKLVRKVNEIIEYISSGFENYVDEHFNDLMVNAVYNEDTETIILMKGVKGDNNE